MEKHDALRSQGKAPGSAGRETTGKLEGFYQQGQEWQN